MFYNFRTNFLVKLQLRKNRFLRFTQGRCKSFQEMSYYVRKLDQILTIVSLKVDTCLLQLLFYI